MEKKYELSIIIPCYNCEKTIERCVTSILKNSYENTEIILVNDGSKDNTLQTLKKISKSNKNIKVINKLNTGVSDTRNCGLDNSKGKYIGFVDSDDYVANDMFKKMIDKAKHDFLDIVCCDFYEVDDKKITKSKFNYKMDHLSKDDGIKMFLNGKISISIWDKIFNYNILENIRFQKELAVGEDSIFCLESIMNSKKIGFINEPLYMYLQNDGSAVHSMSKKILQISKLENYIPEYIKENYNEEYNYYLADCMLRCIHTLSNLCNKNNFNEINMLLLKIYSKDKINILIHSKNTTFFIKNELIILRTFGIKFHLKNYWIYKKIRRMVRK